MFRCRQTRVIVTIVRAVAQYHADQKREKCEERQIEERRDKREIRGQQRAVSREQQKSTREMYNFRSQPTFFGLRLDVWGYLREPCGLRPDV